MVRRRTAEVDQISGRTRTKVRDVQCGRVAPRRRARSGGSGSADMSRPWRSRARRAKRSRTARPPIGRHSRDLGQSDRGVRRHSRSERDCQPATRQQPLLMPPARSTRLGSLVDASQVRRCRSAVRPIRRREGCRRRSHSSPCRSPAQPDYPRCARRDRAVLVRLPRRPQTARQARQGRRPGEYARLEGGHPHRQLPAAIHSPSRARSAAQPHKSSSQIRMPPRIPAVFGTIVALGPSRSGSRSFALPPPI